MKTNLSRVLAISGLAFFTIVGCKDEAKKDSAMAVEKIPGIVLENMDTNANGDGPGLVQFAEHEGR